MGKNSPTLTKQAGGLKEVQVTTGEKTGRALSSRDVTISISLIDEAGAEWNRRRGDVVHEETLKNLFSAAWMVGRAVRDLLLQAK
jgi:hypothetical protein